MGFNFWIQFIIQIFIAIFAVIYMLRLEKKRPTESINPETTEDIVEL